MENEEVGRSERKRLIKRDGITQILLVASVIQTAKLTHRMKWTGTKIRKPFDDEDGKYERSRRRAVPETGLVPPFRSL